MFALGKEHRSGIAYTEPWNQRSSCRPRVLTSVSSAPPLPCERGQLAVGPNITSATINGKFDSSVVVFSLFDFETGSQFTVLAGLEVVCSVDQARL